MSLQELLRAQREATERWIRQKNARGRRLASELEARGHEVYGRAIRAGTKVLAGTTAEIRQLGMAALTGQLPSALADVAARKAAPATQTAARRTVRFVRDVTSDDPKVRARAKRDAGQQVRAATSGAVDEATFGLADRALAAGDALRNGGVGGFIEAYDDGMRSKRADDAYDDAHYGAARNVGRTAGFVGSAAAMGAPVAGRIVMRLAPQGQKAFEAIQAGSRYGVDPRGLTTMAAVGGSSAGVVDQALVDQLSGHRSSPVDYARAGTSGALGAVATRFTGPTTGGAVGGATDSMLGDVIAQRSLSAGEAIEAAHAGAALGRAGDLVGSYRASRASRAAKGEMGEMLTRTKAGLRFEGPVGDFEQPLKLNSGRVTITDARVRKRDGEELIFEAKMGPHADLTRNQREARNQFGDLYIVDGWGFGDVGKILGATTAPLGASLADDEALPWRLR